MARKKLIPMSRATIKADKELEDIDSVAYKKGRYETNRAMDVLLEAQTYWSNMSRFRKERERNKRYVYGDQWGDLVEVGEVCGCKKYMTEEEYIMKQGSIPLKNNHMRKIIKTVLGVYRNQNKEPTCNARDRDEQKLGETMSTILQCNMQLNRMDEVNARTFEEFLIGGFIVQRKWYGWRNEKLDCWTDYVNPNNFFIDSNMRDFRGWDVSCMGEVHDVSFETLCTQFAESPEDYKELKRIYSASHNRSLLGKNLQEFGYSRPSNYDFLFANDHNLCRVIEVWRKESKPRYRCHDYNNGDVYKIDIEDYETMVEAENAARLQQALEVGMSEAEVPLIKAEWFMDNYWYYYYLSPFGHVLDEGETPYAHKQPPYVFKAYPFIDGEIHAFAADFIDQQRYVNRLVTLYDWIMRASAKGVLLIPEDCKPKDMSTEEFAEAWTKFNGMIFYKPSKSGALPQQIANNSTNIGINELLNIQLKFFEEISGVNGPLQGKPGYSGMSNALYSQQVQNATNTIIDILESFSQFVKDAAYKDVKNMQQFYDTKRVFNIAGRGASIVEYDPQKIRDVEFDLDISESSTSPVYRQLANEFLLEIWRANQISLEQLLEHGDFPFADNLLQSIQSQKEQLEQGQTPEGVSPQLMAQAQQGANMGAVNQVSQALRNGMPQS